MNTLIVGRRTFSAGVGVIRALERIAQPILVGEVARGNPQIRVNREAFALPFSGYPVDYSEQFEQNLEVPAEVRIELSAPPTFEAFVQGADPAWQAIEQHLRGR